ncbi:MAG: hypothetical protein H7Z41_18820 [Cytophagales bacterium]|nr:hypothetical protein [Armatimonadota bacterium]
MDATIYRGDKMWRPISLPLADRPLAIAVGSAETDAWFQVRRQLPEGNSALSEAVWAPASARPQEVTEDDAISFRLRRLLNDYAITLVVTRIEAEFGVPFPKAVKTTRELESALRQALPNGPAVVILSLGLANVGDPYRLTSANVTLKGKTVEPLLAPAGRYVISVGGETAGTLDLAPNQLVRETIKLPEKTTGTLLIPSLPRGVTYKNLELRSGETRVPITGKETVVPRGNYSLALESDFYSWRSNVLIEPGPAARISIDTKPNRGIVAFTERPAGMRLNPKSRMWELRGQGGTYNVAFQDGKVEELMIVPGERLVYRRVRREPSERYLRDPNNPKAPPEIWSTDGVVWRAGTESFKPVKRATVKGEAGAIVTSGRREFFIPDNPYAPVMTRKSSTAPWEVYRVADTAPPTAN